MCASTGFVPQWYMNTPGSPAVKRKVKESPGATSLKATFGAIRAAWKSIECGMAPPFVSVISTVCPSRTWTTGPGAPWPSNAQVLYFTPGATSTTMSFSVICTLTRSPAGIGGSDASVGVCAAASSCAFSGTTPAKLFSGSAVLWASGCGSAATAGAATASRLSRASAHMSSAKTPITPTASPSSIAAALKKAPDSVSSR
jgi:hypothetical protein